MEHGHFPLLKKKNIVKYRSQKYKIYCYRPFENENNAEMVILGLCLLSDSASNILAFILKLILVFHKLKIVISLAYHLIYNYGVSYSYQINHLCLDTFVAYV